jgi:hypothetical protein
MEPLPRWFRILMPVGATAAVATLFLSGLAFYAVAAASWSILALGTLYLLKLRRARGASR